MKKALLLLASLWTLAAVSENLLPEAMEQWTVQAKEAYTLERAGDGYRLSPEKGKILVSFASPALPLPAGAVGTAKVRFKGKGKIRLFLIDSGWKKHAEWKNLPQLGGRFQNGDVVEFRTFGLGFHVPGEVNRRYQFRFDIETEEPVEFAAPFLELKPLAVPLNEWQRELNKKSPVDVTAADEAIRITPRQGEMLLTLYEPGGYFPAECMVTFKVKARGSGNLRLFATAADWKKDPVWNATNRSGPEQLLTAEWKEYEFTFPSPAMGQEIRLRIDLKGKEPVELASPELKIQTLDEAASDAAKKKSEQSKLTPKLLFSSDDPVKLTPERGVTLPFPGEFDLSSGSFALWVKFDDDLLFEAVNRAAWSLDGAGLDGKFAHARIHFGNRYFGQSQRFFGGQWHHILYTWSAENGSRVFVDGRITWAHGAPFSGGRAKSLTLGKRGGLPGFSGTVDRVRLYDKELSERQAESLYAELRPLTPFLIDYAGIAGRKQDFRIGFDGKGRQDFSVTVTDSSGGRVAEKTFSAAGNFVETVTFTPAKAEDLLFTVATGEDKLSFKAAILAPERISDRMKPGEVHRKLLDEIDCTAEIPAERYRDDGKARIAEFAGGRFRESAGNVINSGFACRFEVKNPGRPHWLEIDYPDDRARTFYCAIGMIRNERIASPFLDACGVITGGNFPVSSAMQIKRLFFVPDAASFAVIFGRHHNRNGEAGPAVARIRLYELEGELPKLDLAPGGRKIMIWNEDPTMTAYSWFNQFRWIGEDIGFHFWREKYRRMVEYTRYIGWSEWNMLCYDYLGDNTMGDRRLVSSSYGASGGFIPGHLDLMAAMAEREEIPFYLSLNHLSGWSNNSPGGLALEVGLDKISSGFFDAAARGEEAVELFSAENKLAEVRHRALNPIHPEVRKALKRMFRAYAEKFNRNPMFRGLDYQASEPLHFSSPEFGYGDYNVNLFRKETGVRLPEFTGIRRFSERYDWLKKNAWEQWIAWRCAKVEELAAELAAELGGRKLILRVTLGRLTSLEPCLEKGELPDLKKLYREQGIDIDALAKNPLLTVMPDFRPNYSRITGRKADERSLNFSDNLAALWSDPKVRAAQITQHSNLEIYNALGTQLPIRDLWGANMLVSFSTPLPPNRLVMENFAWLVANTDPALINYGWWGNPEAGAEDEFRSFYRAFSFLPEGRFEKLPGLNDPVMARQNGNCIMLVNQCYYPVKLSLAGEKAFTLTDAVSGEKCDPTALEIAPLTLRVLRQNRAVAITRVAQDVPEELQREVGELLARVKTPNAVSRRAQTLYRAGRITAAYYALQHQLLAEELKREELTASLVFDPADNTLYCTVRNGETRNRKEEILFDRKKIPFELAPGEEKRIALLRFEPVPGKRYEFEAKLAGGFLNRRVQCFPAAGKAYLLTGKRFSADFAPSWTPEGITLLIRAEDRDFLPPADSRRMWEHDSIVVYFDQKGNAQPGAGSYDADDLPFRIGLVNGAPVVMRGEPARPENRVKCTIRHEKGETVYEIFFPKETIPEVDLSPGKSCGFSLEVINRFADGTREVLTPHPEPPHRNPGVWAKLSFPEAAR